MTPRNKFLPPLLVGKGIEFPHDVEIQDLYVLKREL